MAAPIITAAAISPECSFMFMPIKRASGIVGSLTFGSDYCICLLAQHLLMFVREIGERKKEREDTESIFLFEINNLGPVRGGWESTLCLSDQNPRRRRRNLPTSLELS